MLKPALPVIEFYLNQDYIAEFLCINKDKPKLQCNGKCHLSKMIEENNDNSKVPTIDFRDYPLALLESYKKTNSAKKTVTRLTFPEYTSGYNFLFNALHDKPPRFMSSLHS